MRWVATSSSSRKHLAPARNAEASPDTPTQRFLHDGQWRIGLGLPAAVGVALAEKQPVVCLIGDGAAMYSIQALWTAVQEKLSIAMVVLNNHGYGAMKSFSQLLGNGEPPGIRLPGISYLDIARGFGAVGVEVTRSSDIYQALQSGETSYRIYSFKKD